jgi:16S rRNA A1518/A1519 N6-dimethyltransferase RsmA/KsgA/DIM1 with predicted DNA glycosylase/AP lyase activity
VRKCFYSATKSKIRFYVCEERKIIVLRGEIITVVKTAFQQRRKTMRNSLKTMNLSDSLREDPIFDLRPEQIDVRNLELTQKNRSRWKSKNQNQSIVTITVKKR